MKKILVIILILSIAFNVFYITKSYFAKQQQKEMFSLFDVKEIDRLRGQANFKENLKTDYPFEFEQKKLYFIQTWDTFRTNTEGAKKYMIKLDSIANMLNSDNLGFYFVSQMDNSIIKQHIQTHHISFKKFILVNNADDFISSIYYEKKLKSKKPTIQFVMDKSGDILYNKTTLYTNPLKDTLLINTINKYK